MTDDGAAAALPMQTGELGRTWSARMRPSGMSVAAFALSAGILCGTILLWQIAVSAHAVSRLILPTPLEVAASFGRGVFQRLWWNDIWITFQETVLGAILGGVTAVVMGALFAYAELLRRAAYPYVLAVQTFPKVALAPLLMAWLGYGIMPKILISAMLAFFPVFTNTLAGFLEVDPSSVELLRSMRASPLQELRYLRLPNAVAFIIPSLDVALVLALLGAIASELAGAEAGLGQVIIERTFQGDTAAVYAVLILLAFIGILLRFMAKACLAGIRRAR